MGASPLIGVYSFFGVILLAAGWSIVPPGRVDASASEAADCAAHRVGVDTSQANYLLDLHFGHAWGQVFKADLTLIKSITVWRKASPDTILDPMPLIITEVDSTGKPIPNRVLLRGPELVVPIGSNLENPVEIKYEFEPPFELPSPGLYWFGIKEGWCDFIFSILADSTNPYPFGEAWQMEPDPFCETLGFPSSYGGRFDLVFEVAFCASTTSVEYPRTWGRIKSHYR